MTTKELNDYILHYLQKDKTQTAIMLTGEWGSGKTYYVEKDLMPFLSDKKVTAVVVSLYGLEDISTISKSIYMELRLHTLSGKHSETVTTGKVIAKNVIKNITGLAGINLGLSDDELKELYESVDLKDKLLILEDIERSNINIINLLGYVNGLVEIYGVKVLLVANEDEILEKSDIEEKRISEDATKYLRIKEKTISDTIQFHGNIEQAIRQIIKEFDNYKLNMMFKENQELYSSVYRTVANSGRKNLRTFIFAIQKTVDVIDKMGTNDYNNEFFECLLLGIICFSSSIKSDNFPKWEGDNFLSDKLGTNDMPLMRFAYDYIRWQTLDVNSVKKTYEAFKEYKFLEKDAEHKDADLRVLGNYFEETEEHVLIALRNIEKKLHTPAAIGIYAYGKLAYYMIYVGSMVGFDYKEACELMIKNAKGIGKKTNTDAEIYFAHTYSIENEALKKEYEDFIKRLSEAISFDGKHLTFSYSPQDIEELYNDICRNKDIYIGEHCFLSKYDQGKIVDMLTKATSKQIQDFRGTLLAVYRYAGKGEFDEKDVEAMKQLLELVEKKYDEDNQWDKIQLMQINCLKLNLKDFIQQMN